MTTSLKTVRVFLVIFVALWLVVVSTPKAHAQDYSGGCDYCGSYDYLGSTTDTSPSYDYLGSTTDTSPSYDYLGSTTDTSPTYDYLGSTADNLGYTLYAPTTDIYGNTTTDVSGVGYSYENYANDYYDYYPTYSSYSTPSYFYSQPFAITAPQYINTRIARTVTTPSQPIVVQQQQQQQQAQPINIVNNNVNTNTNTVTGGGSTAQVIPIYQAPISYPVQYVAPQPIYYPQPQPQPYYQNLYCTITASQNNVSSGQYVYLSWTSSGGVNYATLSGVGNVGPNGNWSVRPYASTNYTLTVYGYNGQSATCNVYVGVNSVQPYVTLNQIPYTGFDFGTAGDIIYWGALLAFALSAAYLVLYYRGGALAFAGSVFPRRKPSASASAAPVVAKKEIAVPAPAIVSPIQPKTVELNLPTQTQQRHTIDSMAIAKGSGAPRIVITRS